MKDQGEKKSPIFGTDLGDLGVIVIAALCTITLLLILFSPSPFERLEKAQIRQEKARLAQEKADRQRKIDQAVASGEVTVGIAPARH